MKRIFSIVTLLLTAVLSGMAIAGNPLGSYFSHQFAPAKTYYIRTDGADT